MKSVDPTSTEPTGAPSPLEKHSETESNGAQARSRAAASGPRSRGTMAEGQAGRPSADRILAPWARALSRRWGSSWARPTAARAAAATGAGRAVEKMKPRQVFTR